MRRPLPSIPILFLAGALLLGSAGVGGDDHGLQDLGYLAGYREAETEGGVLEWAREAVPLGAYFVVSAHRAGAELIDTSGRVLHEWAVPFAVAFPGAEGGSGPSGLGPWWRRARLLPDGGVLAIYEGRGLVRVDADSRVLWARRGGFHHDLDAAPEGGWLVLDRVQEPILGPPVDGARVRAHDRVVRLSSGGERVSALSLEEALAASPWSGLTTGFDGRRDPLHTNTLTVLDGGDAEVDPAFVAGNVLLSFRNLDALAVLDPVAESIVWLLRGPWRAQHEPVLLPTGRLLMFDNRGPADRSRALEVDPRTGTPTWSWAGADLERFRSNQLGSVQPLSNGEVLVTDSMDGRAFQITREGRIVWRYDNPHRVEGERRRVGVLAEVLRVPEEALGWLRERRMPRGGDPHGGHGGR